VSRPPVHGTVNAMATAAARPERAGAMPLIAASAVVVTVVAAGRLLDAGSVPAIGTFVVIFASIVVEALPFVLLGAAVSAAIEVFVPERAFIAVGRLPLAIQLPGAALGGFAFPVCECGSVPVARRLIARGMHPAAGIAFMLAAPVLNPVVLASTWVAYSGRGLGLEMVVGRAVVGLVLALAAGWALGGDRGEDLLRPLEGAPVHTHRGLRAMADHLATDFFFMGRFVVLGAAAAALIQTAVPQGIVSGIATSPVIASLAMMAIAFALSLCSEADAFVAVSFTPFPLGAQLAFLTFGPVVDAKLSLLYGATFRRRFVERLVLVAVPVVLAGSLWFEAIVK
jgi:uncharacterized protein